MTMLGANVYQKLNACRVALQSAELKKSGNNKFAGYSYFELGDFLPTINKLFAEYGLCSVVSFTKDYAELRIINADLPEQVITFSSPMADASLKGCHPIQNLGAVETYSRRYLYMAALEIVEHDALDASQPVKNQAEKFAAKASENGVTPTAGAMENMSDDEQKFIADLAAKVTEAAAFNVQDAINLLDKQHLQAEEKIAVWSLLDSKVRSAIKKEKAKPTADELTAQA